jgi:Flp pilus assembly protein TadG
VIRENKATAFARMRNMIARFRRDRRGNIAIMMALSGLPLIAIVGCVVDYTMATAARTKLQASADAATLTAVSMNSTVVGNAKAMSSDGAVTNGTAYLQNIFTSNAATSPAPTITSSSVTKSSHTVTASLSYSAQVPTAFLGVLGFHNITVTGSSTASYTWAVYINFYVMLDVSGSMSFPSTPDEQKRLMAVNPDNLTGSMGYPQGCQFACHFARQGACQQNGVSGWQVGQGPIPAVGHSYSGYIPNPSPGGYCQGFTITRLGTTPTSFASGTTNATNGNSVNWTNTPVSSCPTDGTPACIQLRADVIGSALNQLFLVVTSNETRSGLSNQFQIGLYPFIQNLCWSSSNNSNSCSVGLTSSLTGSTITNFASQLANLLDTGQDPTLGSGGTHFENALSSMNSHIHNSAIGTGGGPGNGGYLPYVFIITDGSQDYQTQSSGSWSAQNWSSTTDVPYQNSATVMPPNSVDSTDYCATMKNRGISIAILYIPYGQIVNPNASFASNEDGYANANIANIPASLQACASPKFFFTATTPAEITTQLQTMFEAAANAARVTN